jgi:nucleoside-diphosphate-sugar epimerase
VARLFTVYGPGEHRGRLLPSLVHGARTGSVVELTTGVQQRDFTYVEDAVQGLLRLAISPVRAGQIVNVATGSLATVREFAFAAAEELGMPRERLCFGTRPTREDEMRHDPVRIDRLRALTGWTPPGDIAVGIRRALTAGLTLEAGA